MKAWALTRHYPTLTGRERFRFALAAFARRDEAETGRLRATCPRKHYEMYDADFLDLYTGSQDVAFCFSVQWMWLYARFAESIERSPYARMHEAAGEEPRISSGSQLHIAHRWAEQLKGVHAGLLHFCADAGLPWREVLAWWPPILEEIERQRIILDDDRIAADEEQATGIYRTLAAWWPPMSGSVG